MLFLLSYYNDMSTTVVVILVLLCVQGLCVSVAGVIIALAVFLAVQLAVVAAWMCVWQRKTSYKSSTYISDALTLGPAVSRTDSLCKLYDTGYARRF